MNIRVIISYFDKKIGPLVFYFYPEVPPLTDLVSNSIAGLMDQNIDQTFFTFSLDTYHTLNYLFDIDSILGRGKKESILISIIFDEHITQETEQLVFNLCLEFIESIKLIENMYYAFYLNEMSNKTKSEKELIMKNNALVRDMMQELYWATVEETREKTKEEKLDILLNLEHVSETLQVLRRAPKPYEEIKLWFDEKFPKENFDTMIDTLREMRFININLVDGTKKYIYFFKKTLIKEILYREIG